MNRNLLSTALTSILGATALSVSMGASAALTNEQLTIDQGIYGQTCAHDTTFTRGLCFNIMTTFASGSGFSMSANLNSFPPQESHIGL